MNALDCFNIANRVIVITGGGGMLGKKHAEAVLDGGGIPILIDISAKALEEAASELLSYNEHAIIETYTANIASLPEISRIKEDLVSKYGRIDGLINNAANNPKIEHGSANMGNIQFANFPIELWEADISVGLTGALICTQIFGYQMAEQNKGVILNISSDLGVIAPDQRIYRKDGQRRDEQTVKPVTYSVIKHGLIGLTKYTATYWAERGVRANAICPGGVFNGQDSIFLNKLTNLIPMGRMADKDEYKSSILYMISDASTYMTGATVIIDGGRTCW